MNRLEMAQYIVDKFMVHGKKVASTRKGIEHLEWVLVYDDGSEETVTGKFAADLRKACDT